MKKLLSLLLFISVLSVNTDLSSQCIIDGVVADFGECNEEDNFYVHINFEHDNVGDEGFTITGNGMNHGTFQYEDLPVQISDLPGDCETLWEFVVTDLEFEDCSDFTVLGEICCGSSGECEINEVSATTSDCNDDDQFMVDINFNFSNVGDNGFSVTGNGMDHGDFEYGDLPITIGPLDGDCETPWEFIITDNDFENCSAFTELGEICCGSSEDCSITNVVADPGECNEEDEFTVHINFEYSNVGNEGFSVLGNGIDHGDFAYENLPVEIGPLPGNCETPWEFVVIDNQFENCSDFTDLGEICCGIECDISELSVTTGDECNEAGEYAVTIDFDHQGTSGVGFDLWTNGDYFGFYSYDDLPLTIEFPGSGSPFDEIMVCDNDNDDCCASIAFASPCSCLIEDMIIIQSDCDDNGQFNVTINFEYSNTSDWFTVGGNGMSHGEFMYSELPVIIGPLDGDGETEWEFVAVDSESELCFDFAELGIVDCGIQGDCNIYDMVVEAYECDEEGFFLVDLDFEYANVGDHGFIVTVNGIEFGPYEYEDLYITLGPFEGDCETTYSFHAYDVDFPECGDEAAIEPVCCDECQECNISDITVDPIECTGDGVYSLLVNFEYCNVTNDFFDVWSGDDFLGFYAYDDLPITIEEFPERPDNDFDIITICDNDNDSCCSTHEFMGLDCSEGGSDCEIGELNIDVGECNDDGFFSVHINFEYANVGDNGFSVMGNGIDYGDFEYENLPIEINELEGDCETVWEFVVRDNDFEDCASDGAIDPVCCGEECNIWDLVVDPGECTGDGLFLIVLNFEYANVNSDLFDVYGADEFVGTYAYADLPVTIKQFPERVDLEYDIITVCDSDSETCCESLEFMGPNCAEGGNDCEIGELNIDVGECNDDGFFSVHINFEYANVGDNGFSVMGNGNDYGDFEYENLPIEINELEGDCETVWEFVVRDNDFEDCASDGAIDPVCCGEECNIWDLVVDPGECTGDGLFLIVLNFEYANVNSDLFDVYGADEYVGTYAYADLPVTIEQFPERVDLEYDIITVCDSDSETCCESLEFMGPNCAEGGNDCEIGELNIDVGECNDDGFFSVHINFEYANVGDNGFSVMGNGNDYGDFEYENLPIEINELEGDCETVWEFIVRDNDFEDCASDGAIDPVCCSDDCFIGELNIDVGECNDNGFFSVHINFEYANVGDNGFSVMGNGTDYGDFEYGDLPIEINELEGDCETVWEFVVRDNDFEDCASDGAIDPVCCSDDCFIGELNIDVGECNDNGFFSVHINFEYANVGDNGFSVLGNGNDYGDFEYANLPIEINELEGDCETSWEFIVIDNDFEDCASDGGIEPVCCIDDCFISELNIDVGECNDDGFFSVHINFEYANVGDNGFSVLGNGNDYGDFEYGDLPIEIGDLEGDCETPYEFVVIDNDFEDCASDGAIDPVCCSDECFIGELNIDIGECNDDDQFFVFINFEYDNVGDNGFSVMGNGMDYGDFEYENLPVEIGPIAGDCETVWEFVVSDNDFEDCASDGAIEPVCCSDEPLISDIEVETAECDGVGTFSLMLNFVHRNTSEDFNVYSDGNLVGSYQYENLPVFVEHFPEREDSELDLITVCDSEIKGLCESMEFEGLNCTESSSVIDLELENAKIKQDLIGKRIEIVFEDILSKNVNARIIDINGRMIINTKILEGSAYKSFDLSAVPSGVYILVLNSNGYLVNFKFVSI